MATDIPDLSALPLDDAEAASRYAAHRTLDPFPDIDPALLNTADLFNYIATVGMIYPFRCVPEAIDDSLKPASCAVPIRGRYLSWDVMEQSSSPQEVDADLGDDQFLTLRPNSIVYVTLEPMFRLPEYIAGRFNLTIREIYRGLLVGTGPLVDPGFIGRLSVPLHNLTANDYRLAGGEPIVWMEFTKISRHARFQNTEPGERVPEEDRPGRYVEFPPRKRERDVRWYVNRASDGRPIVSSISGTFARTAEAAVAAQGAASSAKQEAEDIRGRFYRLSLVGAAALMLALAAVLVSVWALVWDVRRDVGVSRDRLRQLQRLSDSQANTIKRQRAAINRIESDVVTMRRAIARRSPGSP